MSLAPAAPVYLALVASGLVGACGQLAPVCQTCAPKKYEGTGLVRISAYQAQVDLNQSIAATIVRMPCDQGTRVSA